MRIKELFRRLYRLPQTSATIAGLLLLSSCTPSASTVSLSLVDTSKSTISISQDVITSGKSITITVTSKNEDGLIYISPTPLSVEVSVSGGTSTGTLGPVIDQKNGTYTATYKAISAGTPTTFSAKINGITVKGTFPPPSLTVIAGQITFTVAPSASGNTDTDLAIQPVLSAVDSSGNVATTYSESVTLSAYSDANCTSVVPGGLRANVNPVTAVNGIVIFSGVRILKTNVIRIKASDRSHSICSSAIYVTPGAPASLGITGGNIPAQSAIHGNALANPFVVILKDQQNNPISGAQIDWAITSGGGSLSNGASGTTDLFGLSANTLTTAAPGTETITATLHGTPSLTQTFTASSITQAMSYSLPFDLSTNSSYSFDPTKMDFSAGVCRLTGTDQIDNDGSVSGFGGGTSSNVIWDSGRNTLRLSQAAGMFSTAEFDSSWTPNWANLVSYWKFNNDWLDSVGFRNGSALNGVTFSSSSKLGSHAGQFDGVDDGVTFSDGSLPNMNNPRSFSLWLNPTSLPGIGTSIYLFGYGRNSPDNAYGLALVNSGGTQMISYSGWSDDLNVTYTLPTGIWTHIAGTFDGTTANLYLNGTLIGTADKSLWNTMPSYGWIGQGPAGGNFAGKVDDLAVWTAALTGSEISRIYARQSARYSGTLTSRVMDALSTGQSWTTLSWITPLPFLKALPDYASGAIQNESSADYSALVGTTGAVGDNNLMSGIIGLWHLDEAAGTTGASSVTDKSGNNNHGTPTSVTFGGPGRLGNAANFNGSTSQINGSISSTALSGDYTISAWIYHRSTTQWGAIFSNNVGISSAPALTMIDTTTKIGTSNTGVSATDISVDLGSDHFNKWIFVTLRKSGTAFLVDAWKDGTRISNSGTIYWTPATGSQYYIGRRFTGASEIFDGLVDEVAVWSRSLGDTEIQQLYRRGANRAKFQVRTCTTANCSDDLTGSNWKGPDGTNQTYFSELNNNTKSAPSLQFANFTNPVGTSRFFQYRTILESDDNGSSCNYGSGSTWCSPEIKSITVDPVHYDTSSPSIIGKTGITYYSLSTFTETLGAGCGSGVGYNLGVGAAYSSAIWYFWDSTKATGCGGAGTGAWCPANGTAAQSSTAAGLQAHASTFATQVGTGTVFVKAYLNSSGSSKCEIDQLLLNVQQ